jgi:hypothetical protein
MADAGRYPDPQDVQWLQYFDGERWTGDRRLATPVAPPMAPPAFTAPIPPAPPAAQWPGYGSVPPQWQPPPPAPPRRGRRRLLLVLAAVVLLAAGATTWLLWPKSPSLTYEGKRIASPGSVLKNAEATMRTIVSERHGADNSTTRCYFAKPTKPGANAKKTDVDTALRCGPVLFVDGDKARTYLSFELISGRTSSEKIALTSASSPQRSDPDAVPASLRLVRPDGRTARSGSTDLTVPQPPPAEKDVLTTSELGPTKKPTMLANARMIGKTTGVALVAAAVVTRYGGGDEARSAPAGEQLVAFQVRDESGAISESTAADALTVSVSGGHGRAVPTTSSDEDYVILAMPTAATATLVLVDAGYTQTLSLPAGKPGRNNLAVLTRRHRSTAIGKSAAIPIRFSGVGGSVDMTFNAKVDGAELDFWMPEHATSHPSKPGNALLFVDLYYSESSSPGETFGFDPQVLKLKLPDGRTFSARNIAPAGKILDVFEVPAGFTTGTLGITGSEAVDGVTLSVTQTITFPVVIAAG